MGARSERRRCFEGRYEITPEHGPLTGQSRVEIHPEMIELAELESTRGDDRLAVPKLNQVDIPAEYNAASTLIVEVAENGDNQFDFELQSGKKR